MNQTQVVFFIEKLSNQIEQGHFALVDQFLVDYNEKTADPVLLLIMIRIVMPAQKHLKEWPNLLDRSSKVFLDWGLDPNMLLNKLGRNIL